MHASAAQALCALSLQGVKEECLCVCARARLEGWGVEWTPDWQQMALARTKRPQPHTQSLFISEKLSKINSMESLRLPSVASSLQDPTGKDKQFNGHEHLSKTTAHTPACKPPSCQRACMQRSAVFAPIRACTSALIVCMLVCNLGGVLCALWEIALHAGEEIEAQEQPAQRVLHTAAHLNKILHYPLGCGLFHAAEAVKHGDRENRGWRGVMSGGKRCTRGEETIGGQRHKFCRHTEHATLATTKISLIVSSSSPHAG